MELEETVYEYLTDMEGIVSCTVLGFGTCVSIRSALKCFDM